MGRGFPVVPCSRTDKGAMVPGFGRDAPAELAQFSDPEQVRAWWSGRFKRAHVGLLTGRGTDDGRSLVVVDLDMPKGDARPLEGRWSRLRRRDRRPGAARPGGRPAGSTPHPHPSTADPRLGPGSPARRSTGRPRPSPTQSLPPRRPRPRPRSHWAPMHPP
ncbi:hypothetical protein [Streptomyces collinus]|uniref:hypothetical protein n=1 Tax=Streptomyces collinus TaxID=42684 RepID=UPI00397EB858